VVGTALDVWEIAAASRSYETPSAIAAATDLTGPQIRVALAYYAEVAEEIDAAIAENERSLSEFQRQYPTIDTIAVGD
jgi:uncharacterized protein (DUF433 family)